MQRNIDKQYCFQCKNQGCFVLRYFSPEEIVSISEAKKIRFYKKDEIIYREGEIPEGIYFVYNGCLKTTKTALHNKQIDLFYNEQGEILGYRSVINSEPHSTSAVAYSNSLVCEISKDYFLNSFLNDKNFSENFLKYLTEEVWARQKRIEEFESFRND